MSYIGLFVLCGGLFFSPTDKAVVRVFDESGAGYPGILVIVQSLNNGDEIARLLTDSDGRTPEFLAGSGLYQVIATCPYAPCKTTVREVYGSAMKPELAMTVLAKGTDADGEIVGAPRC